MGDEERSKEAAQEGEEKEMKTLLHCPPIYPLPEEIEKAGKSGSHKGGGRAVTRRRDAAR